jgi:hypothetical protein
MSPVSEIRWRKPRPKLREAVELFIESAEASEVEGRLGGEMSLSGVGASRGHRF